MLDGIKKLLWGDAEDGDDYMDEEEEMNYSGAPESAPSAAPAGKTIGGYAADNAVKRPRPAEGGGKVQVVLVKPERFEDVLPIADQLNQKNTVVLNLEKANQENSRRLVDFLSGVAYANGGKLKLVASDTFIITPFNVAMSGETMDAIESNGVEF